MSTPSPDAHQPPKLLEQVVGRICVKHYSIRTEKAYVDWIKRYILFHNKSHPNTLSEVHVEAFLTHLAVDRNVSFHAKPGQERAIIFV